ncbi:MAG: site-specific integrase [Chloroflexota bacterium]
MDELMLRTAALRLETPSQAILFSLIEQSGLAMTTQRVYKAAIERYLNHGHSLTDTAALATYAADLSPSAQSHLRAAVNLWVKQAIVFAKAQATPETVDETQALIWRLESLTSVIKTEAVKGEKAHIWLTLLEQEKLLNLVDVQTTIGQRDNVLLRLLLGTGLRRAEAAALTFEDVVVMGETTVLDIQGKGKRKRVIPIGQRLGQLLQGWGESVGEGLVLRSVTRGGVVGASLSDVSIFRRVRELGAKMGRPTLAPHDLRRTFAENLRRDGVDIVVISGLLGHESVETTMRYLNLQVDLSVVGADLLPW